MSDSDDENQNTFIELTLSEKSIGEYKKAWKTDKPNVLFGLYNGELYYTFDDNPHNNNDDSDEDEDEDEDNNEDYIIYFINKSGHEYAASSNACTISKTNKKNINIYKIEISRLNDIGVTKPFYEKASKAKKLVDKYFSK